MLPDDLSNSSRIMASTTRTTTSTTRTTTRTTTLRVVDHDELSSEEVRDEATDEAGSQVELTSIVAPPPSGELDPAPNPPPAADIDALPQPPSRIFHALAVTLVLCTLAKLLVASVVFMTSLHVAFAFPFAFWMLCFSAAVAFFSLEFTWCGNNCPPFSRCFAGVGGGGGQARRGQSCLWAVISGAVAFCLAATETLLSMVFVFIIYIITVIALVDIDGTVRPESQPLYNTACAWLVLSAVSGLALLALCCCGYVCMCDQPRVPLEVQYGQPAGQCYTLQRRRPCQSATMRFLAFFGTMTSLALVVPGWAALTPGPYPVRPASVCDPIDPTACLLPYPSSFYLKNVSVLASSGNLSSVAPAAAYATGLKLSLPDEVSPVLRDGSFLSSSGYTDRFWGRLDGFGVGSTVLFGLAGVSNHSSTLEDSACLSCSRTLIIDVDDGFSLVPHFRYINMRDGLPNMVMLQPGQMLSHGHRYVVAVRGMRQRDSPEDDTSTGEDGADGKLCEASPAFQRMREGTFGDGGDEEALARQAHFNSVVFPAVVSAGVDLSSLQLAFDFVTASRSSQLGSMESMRDVAAAEHEATQKEEAGVDVGEAGSKGDDEFKSFKIIKVVPAKCPSLRAGQRNCDPGDATGTTQCKLVPARVYGELTVPDFRVPLGSVEADASFAGQVIRPLRRDPATGLPTNVPPTDGPADKAGGLYHQYKFVVLVPCSVIRAGTDADEDGGAAAAEAAEAAGGTTEAVIHWAHGIFGNRGGARGGEMPGLMERRRAVVYAGDFTGLSTYEVVTGLAHSFLNHPDVGAIVDTLQQTVVWQECLTRAVTQGALGRWVVAKFGLAGPLSAGGGSGGSGGTSASTAAAGESKLDLLGSTPLAFKGLSMGSIFGPAVLGLSQLHTKANLVVPGAPFAFVIPRSAQASPIYAALSVAFHPQDLPSALPYTLTLQLVQCLWDAVDGSGWSSTIASSGGKKRVLIQSALGDAQVPAVAAHLLARSLGASVLEEPIRNITGLPTVQAADLPKSSSVITEWSFAGVPAEPDIREQRPAQGQTTTHNCPKFEMSAEEQLFGFLLDGNISNFCTGADGDEVSGACVSPRDPETQCW